MFSVAFDLQRKGMAEENEFLKESERGFIIDESRPS